MHKRLVILDIDQTILFARIQSQDEGDYQIVVRPYFYQLLQYLANPGRGVHYDVALWTAGTKNYAGTIAKKLFGKFPKKLAFVWSREDCELDSSGNPISKPLIKVWKSSLAIKNNWTPINTIMIEDTYENCWKNPGECLIVPKFSATPQERSDKTLLYLIRFLSKTTGIPNSKISNRNWLEFEKQSEIVKKQDNKDSGIIFVLGVSAVCLVCGILGTMA